MRKEQLLNKDWRFLDQDGTAQNVDIPHTWNNIDGQNGGACVQKGAMSEIREKMLAAVVFDG